MAGILGGFSPVNFIKQAGSYVNPTGGADIWEQFTVSATQATGSDGILTLTFSFQSSGAGGKAWVSGIAAPAYSAVNTGELGYWADGQPVKLIASNSVSPYDIWNVQTSLLISAGTTGKAVKDSLSTVKFLGLK